MLFVFLLTATSFFVVRSSSQPATSAFRSLRFDPNVGQLAPQARFVSTGRDASVFLAGTEAVLEVSRTAPAESSSRQTATRRGMADTESAILRIRPENANANAQIVGLDPLQGKTNYFIGNDPAKWVRDLTGYARVKYEDVYPNIDLIYYGNDEGRLEYDFVVAPGANPNLIKVRIDGADDINVDAGGDLVIKTALGELRQRKPRVYQKHWGVEQDVEASYALNADHEVTFKLANYDTRRDLVIDPQLVFATLLGGSGAEQLTNVAVDGSGNIYLGGHTTSTDFPTAGALQPNKSSGNRSVFISKLNSTGTALIYSTYLGGNGDDPAFRLAVDNAGNAYVSGATNSTNFPTRNEFQSINAGGYDAFLAKLSPSGNSLLYSTYIGGGGFDNSQGVAVDANGNAWVSGMTGSDNFPLRNATQNSRAGGFDSFTIRLDTNQGGSSSVIYSTYFGGNGDDNGVGVTVDGGIAVDPAGNAYITGSTASSNLPTMNAFQASYGGNTDFFVVKRDSNGAILYATYMGGNANDASFGIAADSSGNAYVAAVTLSSNFPTRTPYQAALAGGADAAVAKFDPSGSLVFSTYLGGSGDESAQRVAVDSSGNVYVGGNTASQNFPTTADKLQAYGGGTSDGWIAELSPGGTSLIYSSFIGGSGGDVTLGVAVDAQGNIYVAGYGDSTLFPTTPGVVQPSFRGGSDAFLVKLGPSAKTSLTLSVPGGGAVTGSTLGTGNVVQAGYAAVNISAGVTPYGTAVFTLTQNNTVVSEVGVPASPPTNHARIFIDYGTGVVVAPGEGPININTGLAVANTNTVAADMTFTLRDLTGQTIASGNASLAAGFHRARFIDQLVQLAANFNLPANFPTATRFGTLDITSSQPVSIVALRLTTNQRGETLFTSTPVADLNATPVTTPLYFPQIADGGGYNTSIVLVNTTGSAEAGTLRTFADDGSALVVRPINGTAGTSFPYSIPANGASIFTTDGSPQNVNIGWIQLTTTSGSTPAGAGVFRLRQGGIVVTESGVPSAAPTTHARVYIDKSGGHDTGLAIGNPGSSTLNLTLTAYQQNGSSLIGTANATLNANGHAARFAGQFVSGVPANFTGVLDIASPTPFVALTLRSLTNSRNEFLLTTFPIADATQPAPQPVVFPQIADGGGYVTQVILLSPTGAGTASVSLFGDNGNALAVGK